MNLTGNTIFITGGASGIGKGLAEALHAKGNQVIISGRRTALLQQVTAANPGMDYVELDIEDPGSIAAAAASLTRKYPALNVVINNAGIMKRDSLGGVVDDEVLTSTVTTNLLGPIRMTSALIEHLKKQPAAYVIHVTSGLAFVPLAVSAIYSATKAALHSIILSQRYLLRDTTVKVLELAPPYVQTELLDPRQALDPRAMPLADFISETIDVLGTGTDNVYTQRVLPLRTGVGLNDYEAAFKLNELLGTRE